MRSIIYPSFHFLSTLPSSRVCLVAALAPEPSTPAGNVERLVITSKGVYTARQKPLGTPAAVGGGGGGRGGESVASAAATDDSLFVKLTAQTT